MVGHGARLIYSVASVNLSLRMMTAACASTWVLILLCIPGIPVVPFDGPSIPLRMAVSPPPGLESTPLVLPPAYSGMTRPPGVIMSGSAGLLMSSPRPLCAGAEARLPAPTEDAWYS